MTPKQIKELRKLSKARGCRLTVRKESPSLGGAWRANHVFLNKRESYEDAKMTLAHELSHQLFWEQGKFKIYHDHSTVYFTNRFKTLKAWVRYALKTELAVERRAAKLYATWNVSKPYKPAYKNTPKWFNYLKKYYGPWYLRQQKWEQSK